MHLRFLNADTEGEAAFLAALRLDPSAESIDAAAFFDPADRRGPASLVEAVLRYHDAPPELINRVLAGRRRGADPVRLLAAGLKSTLRFARLPEGSRCRMMLIGPPAAGKTTMMGKLAARGKAPFATVFSTDCDRPGGMEQLADPMSVLGIDAGRLDITAEAMTESGDGRGPLLIDTAGSDADAGFESLGRLARRLGVEPVLVLPATIDRDEAGKFALAARAIGADKLLISRLDMARRLGGPLAAAAAGLAVIGGSITPHFAYGLKDLTPGTLAGHLFDLVQRRGSGPGVG
jgi:flagellar biosynthesis protein FlhF